MYSKIWLGFQYLLLDLPRRKDWLVYFIPQRPTTIIKSSMLRGDQSYPDLGSFSSNLRTGSPVGPDDNLPLLCGSVDWGGLHSAWTLLWLREKYFTTKLPRELLRSGGGGTGRAGRGGVLSRLGYFLYWTSILACRSDITELGGAGRSGAGGGGGEWGGGDGGEGNTVTWGGGGGGGESISGGGEGGGSGGVGGGGVAIVCLVMQERMSCRDSVISRAAPTSPLQPLLSSGVSSLSSRLRLAANISSKCWQHRTLSQWWWHQY